MKRLITEEGVAEFAVGQYGRFDRMAAEAVMLAKKEHREVRLVWVTPYHPAERPLTMPDGFDEMIYPFDQPAPPRFAIMQANEEMIRRSSHLIAYVCRPGKARDFLEYAGRQDIIVTQIGG